MMNKRSQSAMEYLMTYGWAILVVLIALGALFYLGVFSPKTPNTCTGVGPVSCMDTKLGGGVLNLKLGATGVTSITYVAASAITINGVACTITSDGDPNVGLAPDEDEDGTAVNMKSTAVTVTCTPNPVIPTGTKYSGKILLTYDTGSGLTHPAEIQFSGTAEA